MISLLQRVSEASVSVGGETIARIKHGILALVAIEKGDGSLEVERMAEKIVNFRLFEDSSGKMNRDLAASGGELLLVPQFTLAADTASGNRPSFSGSAEPDAARMHFDALVALIKSRGYPVAAGRFGAAMQVALINEGPVTFSLRVNAAARPS